MLGVIDKSFIHANIPARGGEFACNKQPLNPCTDDGNRLGHAFSAAFLSISWLMRIEQKDGPHIEQK
jgi:hypothetical protein